ncbi:hypothetical protein FBQ87_00850 [Sphingobacteriales bacterium CHB3]|nr:hypothetical protein [Sphingobacteriales bacterium CHB3]
MSKATISSTRAAGDAIQGILADHFDGILGDLCGTYSAEFARRAMADIAFTDKDGFYNFVDVKTHRLDTHFDMPNLTSVERLTRFYEDNKNYFVVLTVAYSVKGTRVKVEKVHFVPIEFLSWECLTIGALGWGQIQIANSDKIIVNPKYSRKKWMLLIVGVLFPRWSDIFEVLLWPILALLLYTTFVQVPMVHLRQAVSEVRFVRSAVIGNFLVIPVIVSGLIQFLPDR